MPSPFPGMDPFLEHPDFFPDIHDRFTTHLSEAIQAHLPEPYLARIGRRVWVEVSQRYIGLGRESVARTPATVQFPGQRGRGGGLQRTSRNRGMAE
jgi:Protein of unknown function (DUF4058)